MIAAIFFDLDGTLIGTEETWADVRRSYALSAGGTWHDDAQREMMGMNTPEWSRYLHERLGVPREPATIAEQVESRVLASYARTLPFLPGAREAVARLAAEWPLALVTGSPRRVIDAVLEAGNITQYFRATISADDVARGKPYPDCYELAVRTLGVDAAHSVAVEDSGSGIRSALAAGLRVVAIPNAQYPPHPATLRDAAAVVPSIDALDGTLIRSLA
jgi:HAD superfamily hydrolase (TIGR01509 family)